MCLYISKKKKKYNLLERNWHSKEYHGSPNHPSLGLPGDTLAMSEFLSPCT